MTATEYIKDVSEAEFDKEVIQRSKDIPVVVDFWSVRCQPCMVLKPILEKLVTEQEGKVALAKVNTDNEYNLAQQYNIYALPTVIAFRDGQPFLDFEGALPESELRKFFEHLQPSGAELHAHDAKQLELSSPDEAEKLYREALATDPNQEKAQIGLARVLMQKGEWDEAEKLLENAGSGDEAERVRGLLFIRELAGDIPTEAELQKQLKDNPKDSTLRYQFGCRLALEEKYADALEELYKAGLGNMELGKGKVRETMVKIFHIVGDNDALANEYRGKLAMLLTA